MSPINPVKAKLRAGETVLGMFVSIPSAQVAQHLARAPLDFLWIDMEHGAIDLASLHAMIAATQGTACAPLVRVGKADPIPVKPVLDAGAFGVIFPMLHDAAEARIAVESVRYPPQGIRGVGPHTALARWGLTFPEYLQRANDELLTVLQIETQDALRNLEAILAVPGIDVAFIAAMDLSMSFGKPAQFNDPEVAGAIERAERTILASGAALGGVALSIERARALIARGYRFVALTNDWNLLREGAQAMVEGVKG